MATVQDIYNEVCEDLLEPYQDGAGPGLSLGVVTLAQFIGILNEVIADFLKQTGLIKLIYTQTVFAGISQYTVPDSMMLVEEAFVSGRLIEPSTTESIQNAHRDWRTKLGTPKVWHEDQIAIKTVEIIPTPDYNGTYIPGTSEPDPPHAQAGDWSVLIGGNTVPASVHRGLTLVGQQKATAVTALGDTIPLIPDDFALSYVALAVEERIYMGDNEARDVERSKWCGQQFAEGIAIAKAITGELASD